MTQTWSRDGVRQERSGWRDEAISHRHREWGYNCPCVDLDFVVAEYNYGKPVAIVEYKNRHYNQANTSDPTYQALIDLANGYEGGALPFFIAVYDSEDWWFVVHPLNEAARKHYAHCVGEALNEQRFVKSLYLLRKAKLDEKDKEAIARLNTREPDSGAATNVA